ncbi:hypothetical protein HYPSUDRAFT_895221 [Hypholoma sublateritium FD-334 SS-4]|uniref:Uncharacterized protein n=1 Tax=Hypholoma sublateritium (strain FD-334 SS-4) TaxID=945553 RepID=A0A0D2M7T6_HYPSF|nr:hypothetical protein HYPSUDRAFT_895221 [Hypholoma sublateritium FD-334 SS-4]
MDLVSLPQASAGHNWHSPNTLWARCGCSLSFASTAWSCVAGKSATDQHGLYPRALKDALTTAYYPILIPMRMNWDMCCASGDT